MNLSIRPPLKFEEIQYTGVKPTFWEIQSAVQRFYFHKMLIAFIEKIVQTLYLSSFVSCALLLPIGPKRLL